jgi:hypothetical protein
MAAFSQFFDDVLPEVPGCPNALAEKHIKNACIDFITRTEILRKTVSALDHPGGASAMSLTSVDFVSATEKVVSVLAVWVNDKPLTVYSVEQIQEEWPNWMERIGEPVYAVQEGTALWLVPSPAAALTNVIRVRVSYSPNESSTSLPDAVFEAYREQIAFGAKGRLLAIPKKPWSDPSIAGEYLRSYSRTIDAVAIKAGRGGRTAPMRTTPRFH